ncbi:MAG: regulator of chromosome condensation [Deltaproteobacteria bacterium]|nr:regulator of chromosome condensation [Deltaproteobacteria bacterium]
MVTIPKNLVQYLAGILLLASLTACGGSSSSSETIPNSVTIFYAHNLVFKNNTTLATGYNGFGQLGTGDLKSRDTLGTLAAYYPFKGFATGGVHSVAFLNDGTVMSWGYNGFGQLGNNSTTYSAKPVPVVNFSGAKAVAAGAYHTLALKSDDTLWSWGKNDAGQLGVAENTDLDDSEKKDPGYRVKPVQVKAGGATFSNISSIAANGHHSLARANGLVWAWGLNGSGQLAIDPKTTGALASPSAVAGLPPGGIDAIASGGAFNYALARNGTVWAWGNNDSGQLGNNTTLSSYIPVQVLKAPDVALTDVIQVAAGIQHGLALLRDGTVWAWGYNAFWQLGNVTNQASSNLDSPVAVQVLADAAGAPLKDVTEIRAFGSSSMARIGKDWYVWGDNAFGQLGIGANSRIPLPEKMSGF